MPRFQIQIIFLHFYERLLHRLQYITKAQKQEVTTDYINHDQRWNVRSDQRSLGFRVDQCHVQLTGVKSPIMAFAGVYIYIKTTSNLQRGKTN